MKYDKRLNYKRIKITTIELWFKFQYQTVNAVSYKLGINKVQLEKIVDEWKNNDGYIVVESSLN